MKRDPPLCFVERAPAPGSPAAKAGLRPGDAILRFGNAQSISEITSILQAGVRVNLTVMGKDGVIEDRILMPRPFDPKKPQSLFGCQMSQLCPSVFLPHPALRGLQQVQQDAQPVMKTESEPVQLPVDQSTLMPASTVFLNRPPAWHEDEEGDEASSCSEPDVALINSKDSDLSKDSHPGKNAEAGDDVEPIVDTPAMMEEMHEQHKPRRKARKDPSPASPRQAVPQRANPNGLLASPRCCGSARPACSLPSWRSRGTLVLASLLNLVHGCIFLAAPSLGMKVTAIADALGHDLWSLATARCEEGHGNWTNESITFVDFVRAALLVASLQLFLTVSGLGLAITPSDGSCACCLPPRSGRQQAEWPLSRCWRLLRIIFTVTYPPASLLLWLALAVVTIYCLTFRYDAEELIQGYWDCLDDASGGKIVAEEGGIPRHVFESVTWAIGVCAVADLTALVGLLAACSLIGWRTVLRTSVSVFATISSLAGSLLCLIGGYALHFDDKRLMPHSISTALIGIGLSTSFIGILGLFAARKERGGLLKVYAVLLSLSSLPLAALGMIILAAGAESLHTLIEKVDGASAHLNNKALTGLLQEHKLSLLAVGVLILFMLAMNISMALGLRWINMTTDDGGEYARVPLPDTHQESSTDDESLCAVEQGYDESGRTRKTLDAHKRHSKPEQTKKKRFDSAVKGHRATLAVDSTASRRGSGKQGKCSAKK